MPLGQQYLRLILSRWRLVFGLIAACTLGAWLFSVTVLANKPTFESAARLNIVPTSEELGYANRFVRGSTFDGGSVLLQTYAEFAHTRPIVAPIVDRYIAESFEKLFQRMQDEGRIAPTLPIPTVTRAFAVVADGMFWHRAVDPDFDPATVMPAVLQLIQALLNPVPQPLPSAGSSASLQRETEKSQVRS